MSLISNTPCVITRTVGKDIYGQDQYSDPEDSFCGVVKLDIISEKTTVRTDSSASRGRAHEIEADARLLFESHIELDRNDRVDVMGHSLRVVAIFPRLDVHGDHDHNQVDLMAWVFE